MTDQELEHRKYIIDNILYTSVDEARRFYVPQADAAMLKYCIFKENRMVQPRKSIIKMCESRLRKLEKEDQTSRTKTNTHRALNGRPAVLHRVKEG